MIAKVALLVLLGSAAVMATTKTTTTPAPKGRVTQNLLSTLNANVAAAASESTAWKDAAAEKQWSMLSRNFDIANNLTQVVGLSTTKVMKCREAAKYSLDKMLNNGTKAVAKCFFHYKTEADCEACSNQTLLPFYRESFEEFYKLVNCVRVA